MLKSILVAAALAFAATTASAAIGPIPSLKSSTAASDLVEVKSKGHKGGGKAHHSRGAKAKAHHRSARAKVHHRAKVAHHRARVHHRRHNVHVHKRVNVHVHRHGGRYWWGGRYWRRYYYRPDDWELRGCIFIDGLWLCLW